MKKGIIIKIMAIIIIIINILLNSKVYAVQEKEEDQEELSQLVELKEDELKTKEEYEEKYGSKAYGITAYILNKVRIFSIPFCFLGILAGAIYDYVLGIRHLETKEKGLALMVSFITLGVICQILPLAFTIVVKFGRE